MLDASINSSSVNYFDEFVPYLNNIVKPLHDRLRKNPPPWFDIHTQVVKDIKLKVQSIKCLYLPIPQDLSPSFVTCDCRLQPVTAICSSPSSSLGFVTAVFVGV